MQLKIVKEMTGWQRLSAPRCGEKRVCKSKPEETDDSHWFEKFWGVQINETLHAVVATSAFVTQNCPIKDSFAKSLEAEMFKKCTPQ